jgi:hypothetical protein
MMTIRFARRMESSARFASMLLGRLKPFVKVARITIDEWTSMWQKWPPLWARVLDIPRLFVQASLWSGM